ncbi:MAG: FAD-dependent thymidylate synthase [Candidatus Aenigmarchaeota archaeon]|nr:FAD-dependent thymidylate synthase [Candidatus Aenigmarchaeota archaeon]
MDVAEMSYTHFVVLFSIDDNAESIIAETAKNYYKYPLNTSDAIIIDHIFNHGYWKVFEKITMEIVINTTIYEAIKILQIKPFSFTYLTNTQAPEFDYIHLDVEHSTECREVEHSTECREVKHEDGIFEDQDTLDINDETLKWFTQKQKEQFEQTVVIYNDSIKKGIAPNIAKMLLPLSTRTTIVMTGKISNWIQFLQSKNEDENINSIILPIRTIFDKELPTIGALF